MRMILNNLAWVKYYFIVMQGLITGKSVVNFFGATYIISGNIVKRIR